MLMQVLVDKASSMIDIQDMCVQLMDKNEHKSGEFYKILKDINYVSSHIELLEMHEFSHAYKG